MAGLGFCLIMAVGTIPCIVNGRGHQGRHLSHRLSDLPNITSIDLQRSLLIVKSSISETTIAAKVC